MASKWKWEFNLRAENQHFKIVFIKSIKEHLLLDRERKKHFELKLNDL